MRSHLAIALVLATAAGAATVRAGGSDSWVPADEAIDPVLDAEVSDYVDAMDEGDEATLFAAGGASNPKTQKKKIEAAVKAYERAAKADPKAAEPHWRAATVLFGFYVDCVPSIRNVCDDENPDVWRRVLGHWHAFEDRAPLDPRLTAVLFDRAILHTKLATADDLRAAVADYEAALDRSPLLIDRATVLGNLAESHMMLGDLDEAIENYVQAMRIGAQPSVHYGLAVAYDRDGQGAKAREIFLAHGQDMFDAFRKDLNDVDSQTFFVPDGEEFYYLALGHESLGDHAQAMKDWKRFLDSGAHPQFQPRAREHLKALAAKPRAAERK
jgi:tetratricopeptide (TPR) repeat protein